MLRIKHAVKMIISWETVFKMNQLVKFVLKWSHKTFFDHFRTNSWNIFNSILKYLPYFCKVTECLMILPFFGRYEIWNRKQRQLLLWTICSILHGKKLKIFHFRGWLYLQQQCNTRKLPAMSLSCTIFSSFHFNMKHVVLWNSNNYIFKHTIGCASVVNVIL